MKTRAEWIAEQMIENGMVTQSLAVKKMTLRVRGLEQERDAYKMLCESDRSLAGLIPLMKWGLDQSNEAGFLRVALSEAESRAEASAKDAESLRGALGQARFCISELVPPGKDRDFTLKVINAAIDAAKEQKRG